MDITIGSASEFVRDADEFDQVDLPRLTKAIDVIAAHGEHARTAIDSATRALVETWDLSTTRGERSQHLFAVAWRRLDDLAPGEAQLSRAVAVAHHWLSWPLDEVAVLLELSSGVAAEQLLAADALLVVDPETTHAQSVCRAAEASTLRPPDIASFRAERLASERRARRILLGCIAAAVIVAVVLVSQFVSRSDRSTVAQPEPPRGERTSGGGQQNLPFMSQTHIVADGAGGFVGIGAVRGDRWQHVISRSDDNQSWAAVGELALRPGIGVAEFERSGEHYVAWLEGMTNAPVGTLATIAVSNDLNEWSLHVIRPILDDPPFGLDYERRVAGISVSDDNIMVHIVNQVEIDFVALQLVESLTCGHSIGRTEVVVRLCDDSILDVLALAGLDELPPLHEFVVRRSGTPFVQVGAPVDDSAEVQLTNVDGEFALADEAGLHFARSMDGSRWETISRPRPAFLTSGLVNDVGDLVGVGTLSTGRLMIVTGGENPVVSLDEIIGTTSTNTQASLAFQGESWAVWIQDNDQEKGWLLYSPDGQDWTLVNEMTAPGSELANIILGSSFIIVEQSRRSGSGITATVPIP